VASRCQGRVFFRVYRAKRETLDRESGRHRPVFSRKGQAVKGVWLPNNAYSGLPYTEEVRPADLFDKILGVL